jgi:hypothetical protein
VPLSEHEQRLFEQIERSLAEDPKFASAVRATDPRFHARRRLVLAAVLFVAGIGLMIYAVGHNVLLGVAGFVVMLGSVVLAIQSVRRGRNGGELRAVGGSASRRTRARSSIVDRLEERWRRRPEGNG